MTGTDVKQPTLMRQNRAPVAEIDDSNRLRPVSEAGVESLMASIAETGVMKDAIHLRQKKDGRLCLIAGAHRLEAARRLGWMEIEAKIWTDVTDDWARLMEIDDNLAGAEMNALDTAVFLATRKEVYERLHPETRRGVAGAMGRWDATEPSSVAFAKVTAEKFGLTERQVRKIVAAGSKLGPDQVRALRQAPRPVTLRDLGDIARIAQPTDRYAVVDRLAAGRAKSAADALRSIRAEAGLEGPVKSAADQQYLTLKSAWLRAGATARRRFLEEEFGEISPLVVEEAERRDAAEVAALRRGLAAR